MDKSARSNFFRMETRRRCCCSIRVNYVGYTPGRTKWGLPDECFFRDANGNTSRVLVSDIPGERSNMVRKVPMTTKAETQSAVVGVGADAKRMPTIKVVVC